MGRIDENVVVLVDTLGIPTCFRWREKDYFVGNGASRWFSRSEWWIGERAQKGIGSGALEVEMWRLLAAGDGTTCLFELLHNTSNNSWKLLRRFE